MRVLVLALLVPLLLSPGASALPAAAAPLEAPAADDAWARALVAALPRATAVNDADGDKLFDDLERAYLAAPGARLPVIVSFVAGTSGEEGAALARAAAPGAPVERMFSIVPAYSGALRLDEALAVARLDEVRQVELDDAGAPELETATAFMGADAAVEAFGVTGSLDGAEENATAQDVVIAILDTGFDVGHRDLAGKLVHWVDLGDGKKEPYDDHGHGTHVASIAAGWGRDDGKHRGVAPGAGIVGLRITSESDAIAGYEWIAKNKDAHGIRVATMSFGFGIATDGTTALERAVDAAWDAGVVCFKSNGNSGPGRATMTVPAAARGILGVGSMLDPQGSAAGVPVVGHPGLVLPESFGFHLSTFSSRGPTADGRVKPDLVAPGQSIEAAQVGTKDGYVAFSGTSMAAPFAAGAAALVLAANPALAPDQVRQILRDTAEDWGVQGPDVDYGHGRIRVLEAVRIARSLAGAPAADAAPPVVPFHEVRAGVVRGEPYEGSIDVEDVAHPIAATFIAEGVILSVEIQDASGLPVGRVSDDVPARQVTVAFQPEAPGTYRFRVVAAPGTPFVADFSHGNATSLLDAVEDVLPLAAGETPGATLGEARVPAPGAPLAALALAAAVLARRARRA